MATTTINTTTEQDARILAAYRDLTGNPTAPGPEVKQWLVGHLKRLVHSYETRLANEAASAGITPIDPT